VGFGLDDNGLGGRNPERNEVRTCPARFLISNSNTFVKSQLLGTREIKPLNPICDVPHIYALVVKKKIVGIKDRRGK